MVRTAQGPRRPTRRCPPVHRPCPSARLLHPSRPVLRARAPCARRRPGPGSPTGPTRCLRARAWAGRRAWFRREPRHEAPRVPPHRVPPGPARELARSGSLRRARGVARHRRRARARVRNRQRQRRWCATRCQWRVRCVGAPRCAQQCWAISAPCSGALPSCSGAGRCSFMGNIGLQCSMGG
jgi:hypothetical protein